MIWIWIVAAVLISWRICRGKVAWQHYIWLLLPIEMYGITIAGATFKPYMIFGFVIILNNIAAKGTLSLYREIVLISILLIISDAINGFIISSLMQHLMFILILIIANNYLTSQNKVIDFDAISIVTIATTIGYGIVFTVAYLMVYYDINLPDVYAMDRFETGMVMHSIISGHGNAESFRLRGFCIDPNSVNATLIPGAAFGLANILYRKKNRVNSIFAVIFYFLVTYFSGSRMAFISSCVMVLVMYVIGYRQTTHKRGWLRTGLIAAVLLIVFTVINRNSILEELLYSVDYFFNSRASLTDESGRFTIWVNNIQYLINNNRIWFGVGQNQIYTLTAQGKACHNTWLEWICGTGIFLGIYMCLYFLNAPSFISKKAKELKVLYRQDVLPMILAYIIVLLSISSVDNITNSVMIIFSISFRYGHINWKGGSCDGFEHYNPGV